MGNQGRTPSPKPRLPLARKAATSTNFSEASPAPCTKGPAGMRGSGAGGRALLLLMWQSFPAEGRQNAHDSFFQEMLQTIVTMPLVGMNVKRHDGGAAMLGTLCVGCQRRVLPRTKPAGASFWHCVRREPLLQGLRGKKGKMAAQQTPLPMASYLPVMGTNPVFSQRGDRFYCPRRKTAKTIPNSSIPMRDWNKNRQGIWESALRRLSPSSCLYPPHVFHIQMLP